MPDISLTTEVQYLPGVGPFWAERLKQLKIETVEDLLWHLPREVLDFSLVSHPADLEPDKEQSVRGVVVDVDARELQNRRTLTAALLDCSTDFVRGIWFNQPWMIKRIQPRQVLLFSGKPKRNQGRWEFAHPEIQWLEEGDEKTDSVVITRYRLTEGLKVHRLRQFIESALDLMVDQIEESLPEELRSKLELPSITEALRMVHQPKSKDEYLRGRHRILFDDLFEFQLGIAVRRQQWRSRQNAPLISTSAKLDARIRRLYPFRLTEGQNQAVSDISADFKSGKAMHRLIQADVGAGKTAVAIYAILLAVANGFQVALMAPTELLARQHWDTLNELLLESDLSAELLTGSLKTAERQRLLTNISDGTAQIVVGTQALIQKGVQFHNLGLAIIDEQHKFGVAQRAEFSTEQTLSPHVLVMTATPIPRTLCLTLFGDLDVTIVKDRPEGRQSVVTSLISSEMQKKKAWKFLKEKLHSGRQMYVVCPLIEENNQSEAKSAETIFEKMKASLPEFRLGLVHGRIDQEQRNETMALFRNREIDVLVSTTVIEVGVDVPNATLMVILDAEKFGLSQLHQLRGRIARGKHRGYCFLVSSSENPETQTRLKTLEESSDGFFVAEKDFELRGPGDILGTKQHGALPLRFADGVKDEKVLTLARQTAFQIVEQGHFSHTDYDLVRQRVFDRFAKLLDLPRSG